MPKITVSYKIQLKGITKILEPTIHIYREAVKYLTDIVMLHYTDIQKLLPLGKQSYIEKLIHSSSKRKAKYPAFDKRFYKMPSYLRRSAIQSAIGIVSEYKTLMNIWFTNGCTGRKPFLNRNQNIMPCLYKENMFKRTNGIHYIKIYHRHDWVWYPVVLRKTDLDYVHRFMSEHPGCTESAPVLVKRNHGYSLCFTYEYKTPDECKYIKDEQISRVVSVDLGVNSDAVCSLVHRDGTVTGNKFINSPVEKDRLYTTLNRIKKSQQHGSRKCRRLWRFVDNYNREIAIKTAKAIVSYAIETGCRLIVFEHLGKIKSRTRSQKISLWRKRDIQSRVTEMAKRYGIRISYVSAVNTSNLAYDGSGEVVRDKNNHSLCTFQNGKRYNCDLSASKNIGARYFIRTLIKSLPARERLLLEAKVPEVSTRTRCTLSALINLNAACETFRSAG